MDMEQMDEEALQAAELTLFSLIVKAPLQILDLTVIDPTFFLKK